MPVSKRVLCGCGAAGPWGPKAIMPEGWAKIGSSAYCPSCSPVGQASSRDECDSSPAISSASVRPEARS